MQDSFRHFPRVDVSLYILFSIGKHPTLKQNSFHIFRVRRHLTFTKFEKPTCKLDSDKVLPLLHGARKDFSSIVV